MQISRYKILRFYLNFILSSTRILPMGFSNGIGYSLDTIRKSHENPGMPSTKMEIFEIISRFCATLSTCGCRSLQVVFLIDISLFSTYLTYLTYLANLRADPTGTRMVCRSLLTYLAYLTYLVNLSADLTGTRRERDDLIEDLKIEQQAAAAAHKTFSGLFAVYVHLFSVCVYLFSTYVVSFPNMDLNIEQQAAAAAHKTFIGLFVCVHLLYVYVYLFSYVCKSLFQIWISRSSSRQQLLHRQHSFICFLHMYTSFLCMFTSFLCIFTVYIYFFFIDVSLFSKYGSQDRTTGSSCRAENVYWSVFSICICKYIPFFHMCKSLFQIWISRSSSKW